MRKKTQEHDLRRGKENFNALAKGKLLADGITFESGRLEILEKRNKVNY